MDKLFEVELITPHGVKYEGKVLSVTCPGSEGQFQVLYNHAPFLSSLAIGVLTLRFDSGEKSVYTIGGGVVQVLNNHVRILADSAERTDRIDAARALQARERAEMRLKTKSEDVDTDRARISLMRAINRLKAAGNL